MWPFGDPHASEREFERVAVRVPNPLGDQILATPALQGIRERYAAAHITGYGPQSAADLYDGGPWFDEFLTVDRRGGSWAGAKQLRQRNFDACILLTGSFRTAVVPWLARIPHRYGYRWSGRTPLLTGHWRRPRPGGKKGSYPTKTYFLDLVAKLGAKGGGRVDLPLSVAAERLSEQWLVRQPAA